MVVLAGKKVAPIARHSKNKYGKSLEFSIIHRIFAAEN